MRVVLDGRMAAATGIGRYVRQLVRHLAPVAVARDLEVLVAVNPGDPMAWLPVSERVRPVCHLRRIAPFALREPWALPRALRRFRPDVVHLPNWNGAGDMGVPLVVTLHDLIYWHHPGSCPSRPAHWYARWALRRAARAAARVVAVSQATADDVAATLAVDPARIAVVHHGLPLEAGGGDDGALPTGVAPPFVVSVGTWAPHKNLPVLVEAVARARRAGSALTLVIAGAPGRHAGPVEAAIARHGLGDAVRRVGGVDDAALRGLYRHAVALALPSRIEGFGFTPLEAFALGCPVVASDIAAVREVAGDAALLVPPGDAGALADALRRLETDAAERGRMAELGRARLAAFSWARAAALTADAYAAARGVAAGAA